MNTPVLTPDARRNVVLFSSGSLDGMRGKYSYSQSDSGATVLTFTDVPVFRSGTFRDSMGIQHTWEPMHMDQMAMHYDLLSGRGVFDKVPVRQGHPSFFGPDPILGLVGWHTGLRTEERVNPVDQQTYTYLLASGVIIDPVAATKVENGLFANRSAEVGSYMTNNETEFWPVYQGFAYVDIPAVEGLNSFSKAPGVGVTFSIMDSHEQEAPVTGAAENPPAAPTPTPTPPATPSTAPTTPSGPAPVPAGPQPAAPTPPAQDGAQHGHVAPAFTFTIGGRTTADFAAVQAHITALEEAQRVQAEFARESFVDSLVHDKKITAPQLDSTKAFAKGLSDEQYTAWQATWVVAPAVSLLQAHGRGAVGDGQPPAQQAQVDDQYEIARETIEHLRRGGMQQAQLEQTAAFKRLQALQSQRASA